MQNDLISRSELLKALETWGGDVEVLAQYIKDMPTAYDVEVVVSKMEKVKADVRCAMGVHGPTTNLVCMEMAYENAIQIVRNGGVDNATN